MLCRQRGYSDYKDTLSELFQVLTTEMTEEISLTLPSLCIYKTLLLADEYDKRFHRR